MSLKLNDFQKEIFRTRHAIHPNETYDEAAIRVAQHVSQIELGDKNQEYVKIFAEIIKEGWLSPGGRITFGSGRKDSQLLNCYVIVPQDNIQSIGQTISDMYRISCKGGGVGFSFSKIRPKGDDISGMPNSSPGSISVMKMINEIAEHVRAGSSRRTALMAILDVSHPDLLDFLNIKLTLKELTNFNISVAITNNFINAIRQDKDWNFEFNGRKYHLYKADRMSQGQTDEVSICALNEPDALGRLNYGNKKHFGDQFNNIRKVHIKARDIWDNIIYNAVKIGDPGIYHIDFANQYANVSCFESLASTNPCGEVSLPHKGNCCLGNINLSEMYDETKNDVNWKRLAYTIKHIVRFLDNVLSINNYPIEGCKEISENSRRIGMGVLGLHYLLLKLGYRYGDQKCIEFIERLFATIRNEAYMASVEIAKEKGSFSSFDKDKFLVEGFASQLPPRIKNAIKQYGIRNAIILTMPPTGNTGSTLGVSTGIEPIFAPVYERTFRENNIWKTVRVVDKLFEEFLIKGRDVSHFVGAHDISVEEHLAVQAAIQKFVDNNISKTINIPEDSDPKKISEVVLNYIDHLKGVTIYRTNSRGIEPLKPVKVTDEIIEEIKKQNNNTVQEPLSCSKGTCE